MKDGETFATIIPQKQRNNKNNAGSTINLSECEKILKDEHYISFNKNLYILKVGDFVEGLRVPKVEYEVYYPLLENKLEKANLSLHQNVKKDISIPVNISLNEIDKYNANSGYYNDLCYTLTSESGTYESLKDRRKQFINNNLSICEKGYHFSEYDDITKRAFCSCYTKIKLPMISDISGDIDKLLSDFYKINNIANIKMLKCI